MCFWPFYPLTLPSAPPAEPFAFAGALPQTFAAAPAKAKGSAGALTGDGTVLADRCLSAVTQRRGPLTEEEQRLLRRCQTLWGCDRCQQCCPENAAAAAAPLPELLPREPMLEPGDLALSDRAFRRKYASRAFVWRGAAPLRRNAALLGLWTPQDEQKTDRKER